MEQEGDFAPAGRGRVAAAFAVASLAVALPLLPVFVSVGAVGVVRPVAAAFGSLVAVVAGVKVVAVTWGLASRLPADFQGRRAPVVVD